MSFMCALHLLRTFISMRSNNSCEFNTLQVAGSGARFLFVDCGVGECALKDDVQNYSAKYVTEARKLRSMTA